MKSANILLAQEANIITATAAALYGFEVIAATTIRQAQRLIQENSLDLFVIGIHFDDSNALELVKYIRESTPHLQTPIIMIRVLPTRLANTLRRSVRAVKSLYAISAYLELEKSVDPSRELRAAVTKQLARKNGASVVYDQLSESSRNMLR